jgi:hypothetical protein
LYLLEEIKGEKHMRKILIPLSLILAFQATAEVDIWRNNIPRAFLASAAATLSSVGIYWAKKADDNHSSTNDYATKFTIGGFGASTAFFSIAALAEFFTAMHAKEDPEAFSPALFGLGTAGAVVAFISSIVAFSNPNLKETEAPEPEKQQREKDLTIALHLGWSNFALAVGALTGAILIRGITVTK